MIRLYFMLRAYNFLNENFATVMFFQFFMIMINCISSRLFGAQKGFDEGFVVVIVIVVLF